LAGTVKRKLGFVLSSSKPDEGVSPLPHRAAARPLTWRKRRSISWKRAVSYFLSEGGACKLTLTLAEVVHDDEVNGLTATRMTVAVETGKAAQLDTAEGKSLDFECKGGAVMSIKVSDRASSQHSE
jgi:hypothetical protein